MNRVSVTTLDAYRMMCEEVIGHDDFIAQILRLGPMPTRVDVGAQVHRLIEVGRERFLREYPRPLIDVDAFEGYVEPLDRVGVPEAWISFRLDDIEIRGKVDLINGFDLREFKTTQSSFDPERYMDAYQWRYYLLGTGCNTMTYRVFVIDESKYDGTYIPKSTGEIRLGRYDGMDGDCRALLASYRNWHEDAEASGEFERVAEKFRSAGANATVA